MAWQRSGRHLRLHCLCASQRDAKMCTGNEDSEVILEDLQSCVMSTAAVGFLYWSLWQMLQGWDASLGRAYHLACLRVVHIPSVSHRCTSA